LRRIVEQLGARKGGDRGARGVEVDGLLEFGVDGHRVGAHHRHANAGR